ncbi:MAG: type II toxin-antitoxin system PemK/MazF family toxin [Chloroflexota bacterium]
MLLVARDAAYDVLTWIMAAPLTTRVRTARSIVLLTPSADGVPRRSAVHLDHILSIRVEWLETYVTSLNAARMQEIDRAMRYALALQD